MELVEAEAVEAEAVAQSSHLLRGLSGLTGVVVATGVMVQSM